MARRKQWTVGEHGPRPVDVHVGNQVRARRTILGISQEKLGEALGLTFQQIQKNEKGMNRIGSSRLYELSHILDVPISFFFEGLDEARSEGGEDTLTKRETLELTRAYYRIKSDKVRKQLFGLVKAAAKVED